MKVLITGYAGFIGQHVTQEFLSHEWNVVGLDNYCHSKPLLPQEGLVRVERDIRAGIKDQEGIDAVVHLAAIPSVEWCSMHSLDAELTHIGGTARLLQDSKDLGVGRFIFASSAAVYGDLEIPHNELMGINPLSVYARHKSIGERLVAGSGLKGFNLRFFNVYGAGQDPKSAYSGVITNFLQCRKRKIPVSIYGDGLQTRDFVSVTDIARGIRLACEVPIDCLETVNLGTGVGTSVKTLAGLVSDQVPFFSPAKEKEVRYSIASVRKAKSLLDWESNIDLVTGLNLLGKLYL